MGEPGPAVEETEQGPQTVIPGAEKIGDKELVERKMKGRKGAVVGQKPADEGLFDVAGRGQADIFDVPAKPKPAAPAKAKVPATAAETDAEQIAAVEAAMEPWFSVAEKLTAGGIKKALLPAYEALGETPPAKLTKAIAIEEIRRIMGRVIRELPDVRAELGPKMVEQELSPRVKGSGGAVFERGGITLFGLQRDLPVWAAQLAKAAEPAPTPKKPRKKPVRKKALGVAEFISFEGGVQDQTGELTAMDAHKWHLGQKFRRKLVREDGLPPDYMRERLEEAGYLPPGSDLADFYDLVGKDLSGEPITQVDEAEIQVAEKGKVAAEDHRAQMEDAADRLGIPEVAVARLSDDELASVLETEWKTQFEGEERTLKEIDEAKDVDQKPEEDWLYTFPGPVSSLLLPLREIQKSWQVHVADPILNRLNFYPFKDITLGKLSQEQLYLDKRGELKGHIYRTNKMFDRLATILREGIKADRYFEKARRGLPGRNRSLEEEVFDYLTTKGADPSLLPEIIRGAAIATKSSIKKVGQEMVRRGLISQESYDKYADSYLPRQYLKFLMERTDFGAGLRMSGQGYLKQRKDLPEELRDAYYGEIRDVPFLITKALALPAADLAKQDFLRDISQNPEWVLPSSLVEWVPPGMNTSWKVTPYWLKAEATALRNRSKRMPEEADRKRALEVAARMDEIADNALDDLYANRDDVPENWRKMPNSARYGQMRGLVVRKEIFKDLVGGAGIWVGEKGVYEKGNDWLVTINAIWKTSKVPFNPPTQIRNFISNAVLLDVSGVPFENLPRLYVRAFNELLSAALVDASPKTKALARKLGITPQRGKYYRIGAKHGIQGSTFTSQELIVLRADLIRVLGSKEGAWGQLTRMGEVLARLLNKPGEAYQFSEVLGKTVKIIDAMEREGMSAKDAVAAAQRTLFDYSLAPRFIKALRSRAIGAPFITFYYKAFPAVLQGAFRHPGKIAKYYYIPWILGAGLVASLRDVDDEDVEALQKALWERIRDKSHLYLYPYKDESGRWAFVDFGYFMPWQVHEQTLTNLAEIAGGDMTALHDLYREAGILSGPVPQVGAAILTGIDPWTQREIWKRTDPPREIAYKLFMYAWRTGMPSFLTDMGVTGHVYRSLSHTPNYFGDPPLSLPQAVARLFGINIYPVDPMKTRAANLRKMKFRITEQKRARTMAIRSFNRRQPAHRGEEGRKEREKIYAEHTKMIKELQELRRRYADETEIHKHLR